jgi:hypothetical protein
VISPSYPTHERSPLPTLLQVVAELVGQGERHLRRQRRLSSFEGRGERQSQRIAVERPRHREATNMNEILHPAVRQG